MSDGHSRRLSEGLVTRETGATSDGWIKRRRDAAIDAVIAKIAAELALLAALVLLAGVVITQAWIVALFAGSSRS